MVQDMNGIPINQGSRVRVHQDDVISLATVVDITDPEPTVKQEGFWVDIEKDGSIGREGMMSYILEVIQSDECEVNSISSRVCELGTKCCTVQHNK